MRTRLWGLRTAASLALVLLAAPLAAAPVLTITPGVGIGPITLGMPLGKVSSTLGLQTTPRVSGNRVVYDYAPVGLTVWAADDQVVRVATRNPFHRTGTGVHPGQPWSDTLVSICRGIASTSETSRGYEVSCPFVGIAFEVAGDKLVSIAVFRASPR